MTDKGNDFDYDLVVIGGGSGGLVAANEASKLGAKVAVFDYVTPSPKGTTWGLGGTCVNVGCIPKKLMHNAGILSEAYGDLENYGFTKKGNKEHQWTTLVNNINEHIASLNWNYRIGLKSAGITYLNAKASFKDNKTIKYLDKKSGKEKFVTTKYTIIAIGGRPRYPDIPGIELAISSDDIFKLNKSPGKTLVVGGSYVALECGGFLGSLGHPTDIMIRSIPLRGFDRDMSEKVVNYIDNNQICRVLREFIPIRFEKTSNNQIKVTYQNTQNNDTKTNIYDTVLLAIGRKINSSSLALTDLDIETTSGKIIVTDDNQTNIEGVYVIGDAVLDSLELTPIAIRDGKRVARGLFNNNNLDKKMLVNDFVASSVFTPLEYAFVGLSNEKAEMKYGKDKFETYHSYFTPLEWKITQRGENQCYCKILVNISDDTVIGLHLLSPNAGEIISGYALAINLGLTREQLIESLAVHPTISETIHKLETSLSSGEAATEANC